MTCSNFFLNHSRLRPHRIRLGLFTLLLLTSGLAACQPGGPEPTLVVENGRVIVGDGPVLEEASVAIAGDSILSITQDSVVAPNARRIDASGKTVLPGLIDAHVHLIVSNSGLDSTSVGTFLREEMPEVLRGLLNQGVTTVRSTGDAWPWIGTLRDSVAAGDLAGPRIVAAGPVFTAKGGHPASTLCRGNSFCRSRGTREVASLEQAREDVRKLATEGVDFIKLVSDSTWEIAPVQIEDEMVRAIVDQTHQEGLKAVGHVAVGEHMVRYARMGMDGFVHMPLAEPPSAHRPQRLARVLAKHETPVTTTLSIEIYFTEASARAVLRGTSPQRQNIEERAKHVATLADAGVPIVVGTDWNPTHPAGDDHPAIRAGKATITEMEMLQWGGMSRAAILQAATANAARALEMENKVGTLEEGKLADLIVADGNPLEDLSVLKEPEVVVKGGEVVRSD